MRYLILLLFFFIGDRAAGQNNSECAELAKEYDGIPGCTYNSTVPCETWSSACGNGWIKSHGSPQMKSFGEGKIVYYYYFWNVNSNSGEGMFKAYSFDAGTTYIIHLGLSSFETTGKILVYAAKGLTEGENECGGPIPTGGSIQKQLIYEYIPTDNDWVYPSITFTANDNYSQIWIYPLSTDDGVQYNAAVNRVFVCKDMCSPSLIYNTGVVPSGEKKAGTIVAGTNGGSAAVTIEANQTTTLVAYKSITLVPNFNAVPGSGSLYLKTEPCTSARKSWPDSLDGPTFKIEPTYESDVFGGTQLNYNGRNSYSEDQDNWTAYYNNGQLVLTRKNAILPQGNVVVSDMAGREIAKKNIRKGQADIVIQSPLKQNNVYIIRIITKEKSYNKKIFIQN